MEHQKILSLLNDANDSKLVTRKWNIVSNNSKANNGVGNELKSNLCDSNDTYILVINDITITAAGAK